MEPFTFTDALSGDTLTFDLNASNVYMNERAESDTALDACESVFFPGCSFINYAMPLVQATYNTLVEAGQVDGISVLCCGKILSYEPDGQTIRDAFEDTLVEKLISKKIKRMVCACPNCVKALRGALEKRGFADSIEIMVLPKLLADMGYKLDLDSISKLMGLEDGKTIKFCVHDSCPDRDFGEFADGLRALIPKGGWVDPEHARRRSICCGSLPRAAGKIAQADKCAKLNGQEACAVDADAIITACFSCTFQLNMAQDLLPSVHFLECLYSWRVDWALAPQWMKFRFLFHDSINSEEDGSNRKFVALSDDAPSTKSDDALWEQIDIGAASVADQNAAHEAAISNDNVVVVEE